MSYLRLDLRVRLDYLKSPLQKAFSVVNLLGVELYYIALVNQWLSVTTQIISMIIVHKGYIFQALPPVSLEAL